MSEQPEQRFRNPHRKRAIFFGIVVLVAVLFIAAFYFAVADRFLRELPEVEVSLVCAQDVELLSAANDALDKDNLTTLEDLDKVAEKIKQKTGYADDAACHQIMTIHYAYLGNAVEARNSLDLLTQKLETGQEPIKDQPNIPTLDSIKKHVEFIESQNARHIKNNPYGASE